MIAQRSQEWLRQRIGMITASEFHNLMKNSKGEVEMTEAEIEAYKLEHPRTKNIPTTKKVDVPFSDASYTYLNKKVMERFIPKTGGTLDEYIEERNITNRAMQYGTDMEDDARKRYAREMGCEVFEVEFLPLPGYENICGVSADGIVREQKGGIEIKCPFYIENHMDYLLLETPDDLLSLKPDYYWQCRLNMLAWDLDWYDFVSYCPYISKSRQIKILRIPRDRAIDGEILKRLDLAKAYMEDRIYKIKEAKTIILNY